MKCQNQSKNRSYCICTYEPCPRKGVCCECIRYHVSMAQLPACVFSKGAERSYDRSAKNFMEDFKRR